MDPGKLPMREMLIVTEYPRTLDQVYKNSLVLERLFFRKKEQPLRKVLNFVIIKITILDRIRHLSNQDLDTTLFLSVLLKQESLK